MSSSGRIGRRGRATSPDLLQSATSCHLRVGFRNERGRLLRRPTSSLWVWRLPHKGLASIFVGFLGPDPFCRGLQRGGAPPAGLNYPLLVELGNGEAAKRVNARDYLCQIPCHVRSIPRHLKSEMVDARLSPAFPRPRAFLALPFFIPLYLRAPTPRCRQAKRRSQGSWP